ncbi:AAA family ATPase [Pseudoxanthomonas sacheonensis]|uniref:ATPase n=1 Tax=Pseudoxanthomonas sacheonensis TaxID=443615 RepID=A0ABU1RUT0_9GAMM|nr:ATP-binding protein [Pseudoxanthomonas sacheonensis]MDR6842530.1 putative ATPase [Pseudoxanthomonas sacheonensis]
MNPAEKSRLNYVQMERFKGFEQARADLGDFTVIVGTNAAGKSNLRDALRFLHGLSRGYTLLETIGEKWIEGGVLQWKGLRGGIKEVVFSGANTFALEAGFRIDDATKKRAATYRIEVRVEDSGRVFVDREKLVVDGRGEFIFDSHPDSNPPSQPTDPHHFSVRLKKTPRAGFVGKTLSLLSDRPALTQLAESNQEVPRDVRTFCREVVDALASMRFLDLSPDQMRFPSVKGQKILGDRGENLSSVLELICQEESSKSALIKWIRELTPLDVVDFEFPSDQTGKILVQLKEANGRLTSAYSASDGTLRFLAMVGAFLGAEPARFYFFEELETGLHPTRLHLLLQLIERQSRSGLSQVVATTHSPQLLAFLEKQTLNATLVAYRAENTSDQRLIRLVDLPDAHEVLETQNISRLHAAGWLEDAVSFAITATDCDK